MMSWEPDGTLDVNATLQTVSKQMPQIFQGICQMMGDFADAFEKELFTKGIHSYVLDGDNLRLGLNKDIGFTKEDRAENVRRVAEVGKLMVDAGLVVIVALVSPFKVDRDHAREIFDSGEFIEVWVKTPAEICAQRDPKGLYKKAREGKLPNLTGVGLSTPPNVLK
jgi:bifunctional enzyme CysN/CysC